MLFIPCIDVLLPVGLIVKSADIESELPPTLSDTLLPASRTSTALLLLVIFALWFADVFTPKVLLMEIFKLFDVPELILFCNC